MKDRHILLANVFFAPFSYGGATIVAEQLAQALIQQTGCRISAISAIQRGDLAPYTMIKTETNGIANYVINLPQGRQYAEIYNNPRVTEIIGALMDQLAPDLLHLHCIQDLGAGLIELAHLRGLPIILSVHDFWWICDRQFMIKPDQSYCGQNPVQITACRSCVDNYSAARARHDLLLHQVGMVDLVTYPSQFARTLCESSGLAPGRGHVLENGVTLPGPDFFARQACRRAEDGRLVFGFIGGPSQIKGWPLIKRAFSTLERDDFVVQVVDGSLDGSWWKGVDLSKLPGEWQVVPRFEQSAMDGFYAGIDVLLFMSQWKETFGLAIREALARGVQIIQTDSGGTVEHGATDAADLIPIGASAEVLRNQILAMLHKGAVALPPHPVASYDDQARHFAALAMPLLAASPTKAQT
ncbi:glycosyltransferase [Cypionkella sinensis]|uniref:glycosyltransferase n=1 Tax=Cypionkella sinensis TaxID=1756043 RepID=UPI00363743B2